MREDIQGEFEVSNGLFLEQWIWLVMAAAIIGLHIVLLITCMPQLKREQGLRAIIWWSICFTIPVIGPVIYRVTRASSLMDLSSDSAR